MKITSLFENDDDVGRLQGHYSDFHKDLHGFRPRHHSQDEWNDPAFLQQQIDLLHATMDKMKKTPEGRKALEDEGWIFDNNDQDVAEGTDHEFDMRLAKILKQRGYKAPVKLEQLGMKWIEAIGDVVDLDDYIMVQGNDPDYDGWVSYVFGLGKYAYGAEQGYTTGTAKRVEIDTRNEKGLDEIAGAFPSPSTREKWAKDAAASNAAEAKRQEALKAQQLQKNTAEVEKQQKINHHSLDGVAVPSNEAYENPEEYHVLRHQTKDDIDREITMPAAWTKLKEFDSYQEAQNAYRELKDKFPNQKFTVTSHSKKRREEYRKQHGMHEAKGPCWKKYKQIGMKTKNGKQVPNCVPKK